MAREECTASTKARESWQIFTIMAEFIEATEGLPELRPAVSMFGSAHIKPGNPNYALAADVAPSVSQAEPASLLAVIPACAGMTRKKKMAVPNSNPHKTRRIFL